MTVAIDDDVVTLTPASLQYEVQAWIGTTLIESAELGRCNWPRSDRGSFEWFAADDDPAVSAAFGADDMPLKGPYSPQVRIAVNGRVIKRGYISQPAGSAPDRRVRIVCKDWIDHVWHQHLDPGAPEEPPPDPPDEEDPEPPNLLPPLSAWTAVNCHSSSFTGPDGKPGVMLSCGDEAENDWHFINTSLDLVADGFYEYKLAGSGYLPKATPYAPWHGLEAALFDITLDYTTDNWESAMDDDPFPRDRWEELAGMSIKISTDGGAAKLQFACWSPDHGEGSVGYGGVTLTAVEKVEAPPPREDDPDTPEPTTAFTLEAVFAEAFRLAGMTTTAVTGSAGGHVDLPRSKDLQNCGSLIDQMCDSAKGTAEWFYDAEGDFVVGQALRSGPVRSDMVAGPDGDILVADWESGVEGMATTVILQPGQQPSVRADAPGPVVVPWTTAERVTADVTTPGGIAPVDGYHRFVAEEQVAVTSDQTLVEQTGPLRTPLGGQAPVDWLLGGPGVDYPIAPCQRVQLRNRHGVVDIHKTAQIADITLDPAAGWAVTVELD